MKKIIKMKTEKDFDMEKCVICSDKWKYNFERELEGTKPPYLMSIWFKNKTIIAKLKKKMSDEKESILGSNDRAYICISCALLVNESLMRHLKNFDRQKDKFESERSK